MREREREREREIVYLFVFQCIEPSQLLESTSGLRERERE